MSKVEKNVCIKQQPWIIFTFEYTDYAFSMDILKCDL